MFNVKILESSDKNVKKFVFANDTAGVESVLYKYPSYKERTVMCVSTQCGCPVGCTFCGTGKQYVRNLTAEEIVFQVKEMFRSISSTEETQHNQIDKLQIMFMSMGEPMLNLKNVLKAMEELNRLFPNASLLISTSAPGIKEDHWNDFHSTASNCDKIGLQFSVHEAFEVDRKKLIPMKNMMSLEDIAHEGSVFFYATGRKPYFNYCVHQGNSLQKHADKLAELFDPLIWECTLSVICEADSNMKDTTDEQMPMLMGFDNMMKEHGFGTRLFNPAGTDDIGGGCGQLHATQEWMKNNQDKVKQMNYR